MTAERSISTSESTSAIWMSLCLVTMISLRQTSISMSLSARYVVHKLFGPTSDYAGQEYRRGDYLRKTVQVRHSFALVAAFSSDELTVKT
jgi:hypothetical protein